MAIPIAALMVAASAAQWSRSTADIARRHSAASFNRLSIRKQCLLTRTVGRIRESALTI
jgi:hypothetical protein